MQESPRQALAVFALLFVTAIWGSTFILVKWTIAELDLYYFLFLRFIIASLFMMIIFHKRARRMTFSTLKAGLILGFFLTAAYISQTEGLQYTTASNSALITGLYMVLVPFCAFIVLKRRPNVLSLIGIALAVPGLYLLTQGSIGGTNKGDLITLITTFACAWHIVLTGEFTHKHPVIPIVLVQFIFAAIVCGVMTLLRGGATLAIASIGWITLVITAIFAASFAFAVQTVAQRIIDPTRTGVIFAMEAVFGVLFGYLAGGEVLGRVALIGVALMVAGMIISEIHPLTKGLIKKIVG